MDVPGNSLQLVVIDRIPFPRPDDPLASARQRAVAAHAAGALAWADRIVVTPDSTNMISEACATHAEVDVITPEVAQGRIRRFIDALRERGRIRGFGGSSPIDPTPLRETARVAAEVRARLGL